MRDNKYDQIVYTNNCLNGRPHIKGHRLTISNIVSRVYNASIEAAMEDWCISENTIIQTIHYCSEQRCINVNPEKFCYDCRLEANRLLNDQIVGFSEKTNENGRISTRVKTIKGDIILEGNFELNEKEIGYEFWESAKILSQNDNSKDSFSL